MPGAERCMQCTKDVFQSRELAELPLEREALSPAPTPLHRVLTFSTISFAGPQRQRRFVYVSSHFTIDPWQAHNVLPPPTPALFGGFLEISRSAREIAG